MTDIKQVVIKKRVKVGGSSKKGRQHEVHKGRYARQRIHTTANKIRALEKHLITQSKDKAAIKKLAELKGSKL